MSNRARRFLLACVGFRALREHSPVLYPGFIVIKVSTSRLQEGWVPRNDYQSIDSRAGDRYARRSVRCVSGGPSPGLLDGDLARDVGADQRGRGGGESQVFQVSPDSGGP